MGGKGGGGWEMKTRRGKEGGSGVREEGRPAGKEIKQQIVNFIVFFFLSK